MNVRYVFASVLLFVVICVSCKKNNGVAPTSTVANIDSIVGYYYGTTSGDSLYSYVGGSGLEQQGVNGYSWQDTLIVTSADTSHITVTSKYYSVTFPYYDSLTVFPFTDLQYDITNQNGLITFNSALIDTTDGVNHLVINLWYGYNKNYTSSVYLYKR